MIIITIINGGIYLVCKMKMHCNIISINNVIIILEHLKDGISNGKEDIYSD